MKKVLILLILFLLLTGGAAFFWLNRNAGSMVAKVIEQQGTALTEVPVKVGAFDLSLTRARAELRDFELPNPEGFTDPNAFYLGRMTMDLDVASLAGSTVRISEFVLESPEVTLEVTDDNRTNLLVLAGNISRNLPRKEEAHSNSGEDSGTGADKWLAIDRLRIAGVRLTVHHRRLGEEPKVLTLPDIELENVGGETGLHPGLLGAVILKEITTEGTKAALKSEAGRRATDLLRKALERD
jgi:uncharacterized protein involved in outer membrane biogenesis